MNSQNFHFLCAGAIIGMSFSNWVHAGWLGMITLPLVIAPLTGAIARKETP